MKVTKSSTELLIVGTVVPCVIYVMQGTEVVNICTDLLFHTSARIRSYNLISKSRYPILLFLIYLICRSSKILELEGSLQKQKESTTRLEEERANLLVQVFY